MRRSARLVDLARIVARRFNEDRCMQIASSLTFTSLLALVPLVTIALTVISAFPRFGGLTTALQQFVLDNLMPASADVIVTYTQQFTANAAKLTAVGIAFLVVTSIMMLLTIDRAFNDIWRVRRTRPIVQRVLVYWTLITVGPVLIGGSLSLTSWLVGQAVGLVGGLPGASVALLSVVPIALTSLALSLLYLAMPNRRISARDAALGGLLGGLVFEGVKRAFTLYVAQFGTYKLVYGAFAVVPLFLLWIYVSWLVVILGAVVVAALPEWREGAGQRSSAPGSDFFDALQIMKILWRAHANGEVVMLSGLVGKVTVRVERVEAILDALIGAGWVSRAVPPGWILNRDLQDVTVEDVYRLFVFRAEAHLPARDADPELERMVHELALRVSEGLRVPIETLFRAAEADDQGALRAAAPPG